MTNNNYIPMLPRNMLDKAIVLLLISIVVSFWFVFKNAYPYKADRLLIALGIREAKPPVEMLDFKPTPGPHIDEKTMYPYRHGTFTTFFDRDFITPPPVSITVHNNPPDSVTFVSSTVQGFTYTVHESFKLGQTFTWKAEGIAPLDLL